MLPIQARPPLKAGQQGAPSRQGVCTALPGPTRCPTHLQDAVSHQTPDDSSAAPGQVHALIDLDSGHKGVHEAQNAPHLPLLPWGPRGAWLLLQLGSLADGEAGRWVDQRGLGTWCPRRPESSSVGAVHCVSYCKQGARQIGAPCTTWPSTITAAFIPRRGACPPSW